MLTKDEIALVVEAGQVVAYLADSLSRRTDGGTETAEAAVDCMVASILILADGINNNPAGPLLPYLAKASPHLGRAERIGACRAIARAVGIELRTVEETTMNLISVSGWAIRFRGALVPETFAASSRDAWEKWLGTAHSPTPSADAIEEAQKNGDRAVMVTMKERA